MISAGGGATGALHDFDRPSGCEKKKYGQKKITHTPQVHQIMSYPVYKNNLSNVSCSSHKNNDTAGCSESLFKIFSSEQRETST